MSMLERQRAILEILCSERYTTSENLAERFGVTERTIRNDIVELSRHYPIQTVRGRYGGGIVMGKEFKLSAQYLTPIQTELLLRLKQSLTGDDLSVMDSILHQFALPTRHV